MFLHMALCRIQLVFPSFHTLTSACHFCQAPHHKQSWIQLTAYQPHILSTDEACCRDAGKQSCSQKVKWSLEFESFSEELLSISIREYQSPVNRGTGGIHSTQPSENTYRAGLGTPPRKYIQRFLSLCTASPLNVPVLACQETEAIFT